MDFIQMGNSVAGTIPNYMENIKYSPNVLSKLSYMLWILKNPIYKLISLHLVYNLMNHKSILKPNFLRGSCMIKLKSIILQV